MKKLSIVLAVVFALSCFSLFAFAADYSVTLNDYDTSSFIGSFTQAEGDVSVASILAQAHSTVLTRTALPFPSRATTLSARQQALFPQQAFLPRLPQLKTTKQSPLKMQTASSLTPRPSLKTPPSQLFTLRFPK